MRQPDANNNTQQRAPREVRPLPRARAEEPHQACARALDAEELPPRQSRARIVDDEEDIQEAPPRQSRGRAEELPPRHARARIVDDEEDIQEAPPRQSRSRAEELPPRHARARIVDDEEEAPPPRQVHLQSLFARDHAEEPTRHARTHIVDEPAPRQVHLQSLFARGRAEELPPRQSRTNAEESARQSRAHAEEPTRHARTHIVDEPAPRQVHLQSLFARAHAEELPPRQSRARIVDDEEEAPPPRQSRNRIADDEEPSRQARGRSDDPPRQSRAHERMAELIESDVMEPESLNAELDKIFGLLNIPLPKTLPSRPHEIPEDIDERMRARLGYSPQVEDPRVSPQHSTGSLSPVPSTPPPEPVKRATRGGKAKKGRKGNGKSRK